jgi:hypothetical protein
MNEDWLWWQQDRNVDQSPIALYLGTGATLQKILHCPDDNPNDRQDIPSDIALKQGVYRYSYTINGNVASSNTSGLTESSWQPHKITDFQHAADKILFTEDAGQYAPTTGTPAPPGPNDGNYSPPQDRLTTHHGIAPKQVIAIQTQPSGYAYPIGTQEGINVSAAFFDGHAMSITQDYADDVNHYEMQPGTKSGDGVTIGME